MKVICVPLSKGAMKRLDTDSCTDNDLREVSIGEEEYDRLWNSGIFDQLNAKLDILIDDYEDEIITFEKLELAIEIVREHPQGESDWFRPMRELMEVALERKTGLYFFF